MPKRYIYEPWTAPAEVQRKAGCIIGKDYPKPGMLAKLSDSACGESLELASILLPLQQSFNLHEILVEEAGQIMKAKLNTQPFETGHFLIGYTFLVLF